MAGPSEAEPTDVTEAEPTDVTEAEPTDVTEAEPTDVTEAEPTDVTEAEPTDVTEAEPTDVTAATRPGRGWPNPALTGWGLAVVLAAVAGVEYGWGMRTVVLEPYYAAAVRSMAASWHNFFYGALDPAGTISVDKLPGAFWIQALSARILGVHVWAIVLPEVVEGVLTVLVLYAAVRRLAGPLAGVVAALVLVLTPASVALDRGNISDSLLVLLGVLAADATGRALVNGRWLWAVLAGVWVGLAFQAKMAQAWLLFIPLGVTYLWLGPGRVGRRAVQTAVAGVVTLGVSLSWMTLVTAMPEKGRPYVDGSTSDSLFQQVFQYNGLGRFTGGGLLGHSGTPTSIAARLLGPTLLRFTLSTHASWHRLLSGAGGRDIGWLIPLALLAATAVMVVELRHGAGGAQTGAAAGGAQRGAAAGATGGSRLVLSGAVLWVLWLLVHLVVFSDATSINAYYSADLSPAVAGLVGIGAAVARRERASFLTRLVVAAGLAGTVLYAVWLFRSLVPHEEYPVRAAGALLPIVLVLAVLGIFAWLVLPNLKVALLLGLAAVLAAPAAGGLWIIDHNLGAFDTPWQPDAITVATQQTALQDSPVLALTVNQLEKFDAGARYVFATYSSLVASPFIFATGKEVLPIGGFTGLAPSPTLAQLKADVASGDLRFVLTNPTKDARIEWIEAHCHSLSPKVPGQTRAPLGLYLCSPAAG